MVVYGVEAQEAVVAVAPKDIATAFVKERCT
jgi:hypothetical protein